MQPRAHEESWCEEETRMSGRDAGAGRTIAESFAGRNVTDKRVCATRWNERMEERNQVVMIQGAM